ncbi:MAG: TrmB family transcriptional regulator [Nanoarchaeota archaeon]
MTNVTENLNQFLTDLGLTNLEIRIYDMLLNYGPSLASKISQKTGIHRRNVYDALERLSQKGLVSYIKENNTKLYSVNNPKLIHEQLKQKSQEFETLLPELLNKYNQENEKKETLFFTGKEGLKQIFEDQLEKAQETLIIATAVHVEETIRYFFPRFERIRKEKNIKTKMIMDESADNKKDLKKIPLNEIKFLKNFNKSAMSQYIYGNNVAIVLWTENPFAILIRQKEIAQGFREEFEFFWNLK